jgi:Glutathione S-transferase, N-terminal domain
MKLYDLKTGTNTRRVRIFLAEKGVKLPTVEVDMMKDENKSPDYLSKNPMGTMPGPRAACPWTSRRKESGVLPPPCRVRAA